MYAITQRNLLLILIVIVVAAVVLAVIPLVLLNPANQPYAASLALTHYEMRSVYRGTTPLRNFFLVANVTVENTGPVSLPLPRSDWVLADDLGNDLGNPDARYYADTTLAPGQSSELVLVFDGAYSGAQLYSVTLGMPNGFFVVALA